MIIILYFEGIRPKDLSKFEKKMYYIISLKNCCWFFFRKKHYCTLTMLLPEIR